MVSTALWNRRHQRQALADDVVAEVNTERRERQRVKIDHDYEPQQFIVRYRSVGSLSFDTDAATHRWRVHSADGRINSTHTYRWQAERALEKLGMVREGETA